MISALNQSDPSWTQHNMPILIICAGLGTFAEYMLFIAVIILKIKELIKWLIQADGLISGLISGLFGGFSTNLST